MDSSQRGRSTADTINRKRSSSSLNAPLLPKKRTCSSSPTKREQTPSTHNRIRRRVIVRDYGTPIYKASSYVAIIAALERFAEVNSALADQRRIRVSTRPWFDKWNFSDTEELAESKKGAVVHEGDFKRMVEENIRPYYKSLQP
ncbi:hypothetical protein V499_06628 [Pseudogymnoascus sp. VKM F-103]|nr:hypothetical protein V499_06628 [Pseudogymnoascus sp. VKM F-103]